MLFFILTTFAGMKASASTIVPKDLDSTVPTVHYLEPAYFVTLTVARFEDLSNTHLNFFQRIFFKKAQKKIKKELKKNQKVSIHEYYDTQKGRFKFDFLWFVIGTIIGPFGLLFSFTTKQPKANKISALMGLPVFVLWFGYLFIF